MDQIDINLLEAWRRIGDLCKRDPVEALARFVRRRRPAIALPIRAWCLCVRAADTRIHDYSAIVQPRSAFERQREHDVLLDARLVKRLTKAVVIPWPGVPCWDAGPMLGVSPGMALQRARRGKQLKILRHDYCRMHRKKCKPIPIVYTPSPVDPNAEDAAPPDSIWGTLWRDRSERLPDDFAQWATRVPRFTMWRGRDVFRGWDWRCPRKDCGKLCRYLFSPLPVWTLAKATGEVLELPLPPAAKDEAPLIWRPGREDPPMGEGDREFACKHCWGVRSPTLSNHTGWNEFVAYLSGGLLYGHEVPRPLDEAPFVRKRRPWRRHGISSAPHASASDIDDGPG